MKLAKFSVGQIVSIGISAVIFILALKWVGRRWEIPVLSPVGRAL